MRLRAYLLAVTIVSLACVGTVRAADQAALDAIQAATGGKMKAAKGKAMDVDCGEEVEYEAEAVDLNGDGQLEVMTQEFGSCFGRAGSQMNLYIKDKGGKWQPQFGFPGSPKILDGQEPWVPGHRGAGPGNLLSGVALQRQAVRHRQALPVGARAEAFCASARQEAADRKSPQRSKRPLLPKPRLAGECQVEAEA